MQFAFISHPEGWRHRGCGSRSCRFGGIWRHDSYPLYLRRWTRTYHAIAPLVGKSIKLRVHCLRCRRRPDFSAHRLERASLMTIRSVGSIWHRPSHHLGCGPPDANQFIALTNIRRRMIGFSPGNSTRVMLPAPQGKEKMAAPMFRS